MSHSYSQNVIHVVFSTKDRQKTIAPNFQLKLWAYAVGICKNDGIFLLGVGGIEDHLHLLIQLPPTLALAKAINSIKSNSSRWANQEGQRLAWQQGYGAFSVSYSLVATVLQYINKQKEHHKKMTFQEEFLALLKKHGVEFDPRYVLG
jgi:REP element-mobilizing transposase RayT